MPRTIELSNSVHAQDADRTTTNPSGHVIATLNNLVIGPTIGRDWANLAKARRYYDAHPDQALHLAAATSRTGFVRTVCDSPTTLDEEKFLGVD
jgi:hypothetical protein